MKIIKTLLKALPVLVVSAGYGFFVVGLSAVSSAGADELYPEDLIAEGAAIFDELGCAGCHFPAAPIEGNTAPELRNLAERYTAEEIAALLDAPPGPMPRFDLDRADRLALAAFLLSTF